MSKHSDKQITILSSGVFLTNANKQENIAKFIELSAIVKEEIGAAHYIQLTFIDSFIDKIVIEISRSDFMDKRRLKTILNNHGYQLPACPLTCSKLLDRIITLTPKEQYIATIHGGWYKDKYIFQDTPVSVGTHKVIIRNNQSAYLNTDVSGTVEEWKKHVAIYATFSPILLFVISYAFAGSILRFSGIESGTINLFGDSSSGKTTAELVAKTVSGIAKRESLQDWGITSTSLSECCEAYNDNMLILDEMRKKAKRDIDVLERAEEYTFLIAQGKSNSISNVFNCHEKSRVRNWKVLVLSSSVRSITDLALKYGLNREHGEAHRLIDVPAKTNNKYGIFARLPQKYNQEKDSESLVKTIERKCGKYYGAPLRAFVNGLMKRDMTSNQDRVCGLMDEFYIKSCIGGSGGEKRFACKFAISYAAAILAKELNIVTWRDETIYQSIHQCYINALKHAAKNKK